MTKDPPGTLAVLRLLAGTSLRRLTRALHIARQKLAAAGGRQAVARKSGNGLLVLMVVMVPIFLIQSIAISNNATKQLVAATITEASATADPGAATGALGGRYGHRGYDLLVPAASWPSDRARQTFVTAVALLSVLTALGMLLSSIAGTNLDLGRAEWSFAWLLTFPVATRSLVLAKALEYSLVQLFPWFVLCPLLWQTQRALGVGGALPLALLATATTCLLNGSLRAAFETWLRLRLSLRQIRSVQGACTLLSLALFGVVFTVALAPATPAWFVATAAAAPQWLRWLPAAWPMAVDSHGAVAGVLAVLAATAVLLLCSLLSVRWLRGGVMRSGGVDPGRRGDRQRWAATDRLHGVLGKDLRLLLRDRNFFVQTLCVPVFVIGMQLVVNPGFSSISGSGIALIAYGIGMYSVMFGCFQVLSGEGRALWMLYALPVKVAAVLRDKLRLWATIAVLFGLAAFIAFAARAPSLEPSRIAGDLLFVAAGVWAAAHLAAAIGILGCNPAADHVPQRPKARHVYLYWFFAGTYFAGLQSGDYAVRTAALLVYATLAYAFWQRACDRLPWLLDPVEQARTEISLSDAAAAVVVFFLVQMLVLVVLLAGGSATPGTVDLLPVVIAFVIAGGVTVLLFAMILGARGVAVRAAVGLEAAPPGRRARHLLAGGGVGCLCGAVAVGYVHAVRAFGWFELPKPEPADLTLLLVLACAAAPLFEEIIFRGLLFRGLLRTLPLRLALPWSAALFASVHPVHSWAPVFGLGLGTALVFHRTGSLLAAMATHAVYNAIVTLLVA